MKKIFLLSVGFLVVPVLAFAQVVDINGQTGASQSIVGDGINIGVSSTGDITTVAWTGILQPSGGGTGADMTPYTPGSVLFWDGNKISEGAAGLNYDYTT